MCAKNINPGKMEFLFGGTFDPVHLGHLAIIERLKQQAPEIPIRLIPCAIPALKASPTSTFEQRTEMLEMATANLANIIIDKRESEREGASYMVDTLSSLSREFPEKQFILVMGADSVAELTRWHQWQKLSQACHLLVLNRPGIDLELIKLSIKKAQFSFCDNFSTLAQKRCGLAFLLEMAEKPQSSTEIRQSFRQYEQNNLELDSMLPQSVIKYIVKYRLYQ